ncbi:hypothetical protein ARV1_gp18 [Acidianus rod-shaped virus 1]|uniref:Uncharacterized protein n=1 Tax=Acidianus rod-shaped virus 1 TaxID=309181 RepID=Q50I53_9VIRU|nr:hypothetical protein ARV1_gp18 [Acidianus rod-shaped virus 1]CAI44173.1 hypothetical protein [Acidianus rod-shaped virus 1]
MMKGRKNSPVIDWAKYAYDIRKTTKMFCYAIGFTPASVIVAMGYAGKIASILYKYCVNDPNMDTIHDFINASIAYYTTAYHVDKIALECIADMAIKLKCEQRNAEKVLEEEINRYYMLISVKKS